MEQQSYNAELYPLHDPTLLAKTIVEAQHSLETEGIAVFKNFLTPSFIETCLNEINPLAEKAYVSTKSHNVYLDDKITSGAAKIICDTTVGSVAYDELGEESSLAKLYKDDQVRHFIAKVLKQERNFYLLDDPLGAASVNVFKGGFQHGWHFDESEYTTTICLQMPEKGGEFVYTNRLRSSQDDMVTDRVLRTLEGKEERHILDFEPGTLALFAGRYSLHKVEKVYGDRYRLVAVFCYATEPGCRNSEGVQKQFWGRSK